MPRRHFRGGRRRLSHVLVAVLALALTDLTVDSLNASALFDLLVPPLHMVSLGVVLPLFGTPSARADFPLLASRVPSCWRSHCEPAEAMYPVSGRRGVEDVIVAEDFTFAASSVMGDDVTGLWFPACDAVDALTFSSLGHWRPCYRNFTTPSMSIFVRLTTQVDETGRLSDLAFRVVQDCKHRPQSCADSVNMPSWLQ